MMTKQLLLTISLSCLMIACKHDKSTKNQELINTKQAVNTAKAISVDSLLSNTSYFLDKTIVIKGAVVQTCKFSGKRCFLAGLTPDNIIRIEAKGAIGGFNKELIGSDIAVKGILKLKKIAIDDIEQQLTMLKQKRHEKPNKTLEPNTEERELEKMKLWINDHHASYFPVYYLDGQDYDMLF